MELFGSKKDCCGCTACKNICPKKAIKMKCDEEGFLYPIIDDSICIECGLCVQVCPLKTEIEIKEHLKEPMVYAIKHNSDSVRMLSSSGGVYTAISDLFIKNEKGICYGAAFDQNFKVCHSAAKTIDERNKFRGSKYVQSDLGDIFSEIKLNLIDGKRIFFTGTPCQTAGLLKYLEKAKIDTGNLILNDIICHGTPSPKVWKDYVGFIESNHRSKLKNYTFRFKEKGWRGYNIKAEFENGEHKLNTKDMFKYIKLFNSNLTLRPSCYYCKFANTNRPSDIMIGDFWGIENSIPEFEDEKGVSLVFVNTKQGKEIFNEIENDINYRISSIKKCLQLNLKEPTKMPRNREKFWEDYKNNGFNYISKKYTDQNLSVRIKRLIIDILGYTKLLSIIKKVLKR